MNNRERILAIFKYQNYDRMPVVHFGFLVEAIQKWVQEGHLSEEEGQGIADNSPKEQALTAKLGFDCNYYGGFMPDMGIVPIFETKLIEETPDGFQKIQTSSGAVILQRADAGSIPAEVDHILKGRKEWDEQFVHRLQFSEDRVNNIPILCGDRVLPFGQGGSDYLASAPREMPLLLHCGSLYGHLRNYVGVENLCYLLADDEPLFDEMINTIAELDYRCTEAALASGVQFDIGHFWEDICFKNGPLVSPKVFREKVGPHYKRITDMLAKHGIDLVSLDCDGMIDALLPIWLENGVNVMFPIEVGTWDANIKPWREQYGKALLGIGGMDKKVFAKDYAAVDVEIERLKPLIDLGGYIPCVDHRIPGDAKWENIQYYCQRMRETF